MGTRATAESMPPPKLLKQIEEPAGARCDLSDKRRGLMYAPICSTGSASVHGWLRPWHITILLICGCQLLSPTES